MRRHGKSYNTTLFLPRAVVIHLEISKTNFVKLDILHYYYLETRKGAQLRKCGFDGRKYIVRIKSSLALNNMAKQFLSDSRKSWNEKKPSKIKQRRNTTTVDGNIGSSAQGIKGRRFTISENVGFAQNAEEASNTEMTVAPQKKVTFNTNVMVHELMEISKKNIPFGRGRPRSASMSGEGCSKWFSQSPVSNNNNGNASSMDSLVNESSHPSILSTMVVDSFGAETEHESQVYDNQAEKDVSSEVSIEQMPVECPEEIDLSDLINLNVSNEAEKVEPFMEETDYHQAEYSSATGNVDNVPTATLIDIESSIENEDTHVVVQHGTLGGNWIDDLFGFNDANYANMDRPIEPLVPAGLFDENARPNVKRAIPNLLPLRKKTKLLTAGEMIMAVCADFDAKFQLPNHGVQDDVSINIDFDVGGDFGECQFD